MMGGADDILTINSSLATGANWFTISPQSDNSKIWMVTGDNYALQMSSNSAASVRPSFYLKSDVKIEDVNGDVGNEMPNKPYEIVQR